MKLKRTAILILRGFSKEEKERLAQVAGVTLKTLYTWIEENNDGLTKAAVLKTIREETGLVDEDLLEEDSVEKVGR